MYSIDISKYIVPLTNDNINQLKIPDLNITDELHDLTKMKLSIIRKKIINFQLDDEFQGIFNSMLYNIQKIYENFIIELDGEYGNPAEIKWKYSANPTKEKELLTEREKHLKQFKNLVISNSQFIIDNRDKILERIDEVYNTIAEKVADDLKVKRKQVSNEIITCECGATSYRKNLTTHKKSKQHIIFIQKKELDEIKQSYQGTAFPEPLAVETGVSPQSKPLASETGACGVSPQSKPKPKPKLKPKPKEETDDEPENESDDEPEEEIIKLEIDYNGKRYKYMSIKNLSTGNVSRDWKQGMFSQTGKILRELDNFATKTLGLDIYVPPNITDVIFV